jgi:hypothetical protein
VQGEVAEAHVNDPGVDVTVYVVIADPPILAGGDHDTLADAASGEATTFIGAPGTAPAVGVTPVDAVDAALVPTEFVAVAVNVYVVPFVSPVTVQVNVGDVAVHVNEPGDDVTV